MYNITNNINILFNYSELTDLLGEKHSIQPLAVSGRNDLVLKEQLHSNKENNAA